MKHVTPLLARLAPFGLLFLAQAHSFGGSAKSGQGTMTVAPATVNTQSTNSFSFAFRAPKNVFNPGSQVSLSIPLGWSAPQTTNASTAGFVGVTPVLGGSSASLSAISGAGPWVVTVLFSTSQKNGGFNLAYQGAVAPTTGGVYTFAAQSQQAGGPLTRLKSGSPLVTVNSLMDSNTTTSITASSGVTIYGNWVSFTGSVSSVGAPRVPTGTVTFELGDVVLGTVPLNGQAWASFSTNRLSVPDSPDSIIAVYSGDSNFNASVSAPLLETVNPAAVTFSGLTASNKLYDATLAASLNPAAATLQGLLPGDDVGLDISAATASFADQNAGVQKPVSAAGLALLGADSGNYTVTSTAAVLGDILPAPLTVMADDTNRLFAAPNPPFSASFVGFMGGDTAAVVSGAPLLSTTADASSSVAGSPYPISVTKGTLSAVNYSFVFVPGRLTIIPGPGQPQKIYAVTRQPDGTLRLLCGGASGQTYTLQATSDLLLGPWLPVLTNTTDGSGWMTCLDSFATNAQLRFYRTSLP